MATWRKKIGQALASRGETWGDVVAMAFGPVRRYGEEDEAERADPQVALDEEFDDGYGGAEGRIFTVWTAKRVYFPTEYDGAEGVASAPRDPCDEPTPHT